jgi:hypothetical protein
LAAERDARRLLEQRALSLFASAGVVAGLAGVAARGVSLPVPASVALVVSIVALGIGAILGLLVAFPILIGEAIKPDELLASVGDVDAGGQVEGDWDEPSENHLKRASRARINAIRAARSGNQTKATILRWGVGFAIGGISALLFAVTWAAIAATA